MDPVSRTVGLIGSIGADVSRIDAGQGVCKAAVRRGRSNHAATHSRLIAHCARRCEQRAERVDAPGRAPAEMCGGAAWPSGVL